MFALGRVRNEATKDLPSVHSQLLRKSMFCSVGLQSSITAAERTEGEDGSPVPARSDNQQQAGG